MGERELIETVVDDWQKVAALQGNVLSIPKVYAASLVNDLLAALASRPAEAEGWVLVPRTIVSPMIEDLTPRHGEWGACETVQDQYDLMRTCWTRALSAAPKP
jgi:hypothetical protein